MKCSCCGYESDDDQEFSTFGYETLCLKYCLIEDKGVDNMKKKLSNFSEQEIEKMMWNAEMAIEARCEWCTQLGKGNFCLVFGRIVNPKANRFCGRYSPE